MADAYRELFERSADCRLIIDGDRFVDCNAAAAQLFGATNRGEMLTIHPSDISPPTQPDGSDSFTKANEMIRIAFEKGSHRFEWDHQTLDGRLFEAEVLLTAISEPGRRVLHSVVRDVSERKRLERELRYAQKMETVGKLAGGIAHDFNNLLVVVLGGCDLLETGELDSEARDHVEQIRQAAERGAGLIRQLLTFSRRQEVQQERVDFAEVVKEMMSMLRRLVGENIELDVNADESAPVFANRGQLEQVILNLVSNAEDAMPDGGRLEVELTVDSDDAVLRVTDNGTGMDEEVASQIWEPFFTTKSNAGTGLGLATVSNIVEQSGGSAVVESVPGEGTTIIVRLPRLERAAESSDPDHDQPIEVVGARLLVVEDDSAIRRMLEMLLVAAGHEVVVASDGEQGFELALQDDSFDLIMTDVIMPRLSGPDMILKLRAERVETPVVFMSGYTGATMKRLDALGESFDVVEKPFNLRTLQKRVQSILDKGR